MKIHIKQPVALHEIGNQEVNEDFIFPLQNQANSEENLFIVCDGQGGINMGEVASKMVALLFAKYFAKTPVPEEMDQAYLNGALKNAEDELSKYIEAHPESKGMSTTLSLFHFGEKQVTMAWVGNSNAYYFSRQRKHLISTLQLNKAANRDVSQEAIRGNYAPASIHMETIPIKNIGKSDYFFLATDGIDEQVDINTLETIFYTEHDPGPDFLLQEINNLSQGFTQDNYSCYLIQVEKVVDPAVAKIIPTKEGIEKSTTAPAAIAKVEETVEPRERSTFWIYAALGVLLVAVLWLISLAVWNNQQAKKYKELMARGEASLSQRDYQLAIAQFDSALTYTKDPMNRDLAELQSKKASTLLNGSKDSEEEPLESLTATADQYVLSGDDFFKNEQYEDAIKAYRKAERVKERDGEKLPEIPWNKIAEAHMHLGNQVYESSDKDCSKALASYDKAFKIFESPEFNGESDMYQLAQQRANECRSYLSNLPEPQVGEKLAVNQSTEGNSSNSRSIAPRAEQKEATKPSVTSTSSSASARKSSPASSLNTRSLNPEVAAQMKKELAAGKRLFVKARTTKSDYEYKLAVQNLENAAPILDGPGAYMLAYLYHAGLGVEKDKVKALKYAQKSALKGWSAGEYLYGHLLLLRQFPRDTLTARQSLKKAADQNYHDAIERLQALDQ